MRNNKFLVIIIVVSMLIIASFVLLRKYQKSKCGDNICQNFEQKNGSCPKDCFKPIETGKQEEACNFKSMEKIGDGAFPKWSPDGSLIAFTKETEDPNDPQGIAYQIYTMKPDGTNIKCITCDKPELQNTRWRGQPYWHPSSKYIVFTAETTKYPRKGNGASARPGIGRNNNVWIGKIDGSAFWQMTDFPENWGVIRPSFSHDGKILYWNEEFQMEKYPSGKPGIDNHPGCYWGNENYKYRKGEELCSWRNSISDLTFENNVPKISNTKKINPPDGFTMIEGEGFTPDDKNFVYSYCDIAKQDGKCFWGEIYTSDLDGKNFKLLTDSYRVHNENGEFSPDGKKIIWNHGLGLPGEGIEVWIMDADGNNRMRLTHFSEPGYPEYNEFARELPEITWNPDGKSFVFSHVNSDAKSGLSPHTKGDLWKINFEGNCGNNR